MSLLKVFDPLLAWIPVVGIERPADVGPDAVDYRLSIIDWWAHAPAPRRLPLPPHDPLVTSPLAHSSPSQPLYTGIDSFV